MNKTNLKLTQSFSKTVQVIGVKGKGFDFWSQITNSAIFYCAMNLRFP